MAVGKSAEPADRDKLVIRIGDKPVTRNGMVRPDHDEAYATKHFKGTDVRIAIDVGVGKGTARVWTCDLTHGYIHINARSEAHTSELQSLMRISSAVFCLKKKNTTPSIHIIQQITNK